MAADNLMSPVRVLVVENDPQQRADTIETLKGWDCECYAAEAPADAEDAFSALLEDAILKAHCYRCHLALVDMRLRDDSDREDTSGLDLVGKLAPTVSIILSAYGDTNTVSTALDSDLDIPKRAYTFLGKEAGPEALRKTIVKAIKSQWPCFRDQTEIDWAYSVPSSQYLIRRLFPSDPQIPGDEIEELLWCLYPDATVLHVESLESTDGEPSTGIRPRSIVIRVKEGRKNEWDIVKFARSDRPVDEFDNYRKYVDGGFPHRYHATLKGVVTLWDVRGARYEYVGNWGKMVLFRTFYRTKESSEICSVISKFGDAWRDQYSRTRTVDEKQSVFESFRQVWGENWYERTRLANESLSKASDDFQGWFRQLRLSDPIVWLKQRVEINTGGGRDRSPHGVTKAILHGDLQGDNCFVDEEHKDLWTIDFERTGPGPIVQDWVELENDILTRLARYSIHNRQSILLLLASLASPIVADFWKPKPMVADDVQIQKAFATISELRKQAEKTTGLEHDTRLYRWGLLLNVCFRLTLVSENAAEAVQDGYLSTFELSLLVGAIVCRSLEHRAGETWPPQEWSRPKEIEILIGSAPTPTSPDRGLALLIGVGNTPNDPRLSLPTTVKDAEQLRTVLRDQAAGFPASNVRMLCNETASLSKIQKELKWLAEQATANPESTVIVYFSGHGGRLQGSQDYFLVPSDIDPDRLNDTVLWSSKFTELLRAIEAKRLLVLIDACHAAGMASAKESSLLREHGFIEAPPPESLLRKWKQLPSSGAKQSDAMPRQGEGRAVISSCRSEQSSYIRKDGTLSIFTHHLREALTGQTNKSGERSVTLSTLIQHLSRAVPESAWHDHRRVQMPWTELAGEDFQVVATHDTIEPMSVPTVHLTRKATTERPDFLLVTALREEHDALLRGLPGNRKLPPVADDIATCYQADLPVLSPDDSTTGAYRTIIMPLMAMGRVRAATATANAISRWHPRYIILIGIAGGIAAHGVRIGDVLVSDQIVDYELQKITAEGPEIRYVVHQADPRLLNACQTFSVGNWNDHVQARRPTSGKPTLHVGPIASGDKVVSFAAALTRYRTAWPKLIGVEMEAAGVATAAFQSSDQPGFFMIRCVSDLADENKSSTQTKRWRNYACDVAASYAIALLQSGPVPFVQ